MEKNFYSIIKDDVLLKFNPKDLDADGNFFIPSFIKKIERCAFDSCKEIKSITISQNVESIGDGCFINCTSLEEVCFDGNVKIIPNVCFWGCSSLKKVILNDSIIQIGNGSFFGCRNLEEINFPSSIEKIGHGAFFSCSNLKQIILPENILEIGNNTFDGCFNLTSINLPSNLKTLGESVFKQCELLKEITINEKPIKVSKSLLKDINKIYPFVKYAIDNKKFVLNNIGIMLNTNENEIENFYKHTKEWKEVINAYSKRWEKLINNSVYLEYFSKNIFANLYQICSVLGLFQENNKETLEFIKENVIELSPSKLHKLYGKLNVKEHGYNKEFAQFYIKNFTSPQILESGAKLYFMEKQVQDLDESGAQIINYTASIYNNWEKIKDAYPNKTVVADRIRASQNNNLYLDEIIKVLNEIRYDNVLTGNEKMATMVSKYGYSQKDFELLQSWFESGKKLKKDDLILKIHDDEVLDGVTYKLMDKNDPETLIIGEKTNCCQTVDDSGKECVKYGVISPNSGFVKFSYNGKIIGQAWVWYNPKTKTVCLDNIEIPIIWIKQLKNKEILSSFESCLVRMANAFKSKMKENGDEVKLVTIGAGFVDLPGIEKFKRIKVNQDHLPDDYMGYSDASIYQYIIPENVLELIIEEKQQ